MIDPHDPLPSVFHLQAGIEFGTAVEDGDFNRAVEYLEKLEMTAETEAMWRTLARMSLESRHLHIAERCYAALGDVSKAKYLRETLNVADVAADSFGGDGMDAPEVWARLYVLDKQFKAAEGIYLEQNRLDDAIQMYQRLHMWDEALNLAEAKGHSNLEELKDSHARWLLETGQEEKAGAIKEQEGEILEALCICCSARTRSWCSSSAVLATELSGRVMSVCPMIEAFMDIST